MKVFVIFIITLTSFISNCSTLGSLSTSSESLNSVSTSLNSISTALNSVSSVSKSLASVSASSASEDDKKSSMYIRDVEHLTYLFLTGKTSTWEEHLQGISQTYGYLTWKETSHSFIGIGRGLRKAQISEREYTSFLQNLNTQDSKMRSLINLGYKGK